MSAAAVLNQYPAGPPSLNPPFRFLPTWPPPGGPRGRLGAPDVHAHARDSRRKRSRTVRRDYLSVVCGLRFSTRADGRKRFSTKTYRKLAENSRKNVVQESCTPVLCEISSHECESRYLEARGSNPRTSAHPGLARPLNSNKSLAQSFNCRQFTR